MAKWNVGDKLGNLLITNVTSKNRNKKYDLKCCCGKEFSLTHASILDKSKKNRLDCGCINPPRLSKYKTALIGKTNNNLLAIKYIYTKNKKNYWLCKCNCGNYTEISSNNFKKATCCGKCKDTYHPNSKGYEEIPQYLLKSIEKGALDRNLEYDVKPIYLWNKFLEQERKCSLSGRHLYFSNQSKTNTASLDRIDSKYGYTEGNIQWVHKDINIMKNRFNEEYFINTCEEIYNKSKEKIEEITRPSWMDYFLFIAAAVSSRSCDAQTKVGAVLTTKDNRIIGTGYNSFPRGMPDESIANLRDEKYRYIIHAEQNCFANSSSNLSMLNDLNLYLTMHPCTECFKIILSYGIKNIYVLDTPTSKNTVKNKDFFELMLFNSNINYYLVKPDFYNIINSVNNFVVPKHELNDMAQQINKVCIE